jgi:predicted ATP-binding protein involved in virulence
MRIDHLTLKRFKGFEERRFSFHPSFNLLIGKNGSGKTSALDALAVAVGSWFLGIKGANTRHILASEVQLRPIAFAGHGGQQESEEITWEPAVPCEVSASGVVMGQSVDWLRSITSPGGRTSYRHAAQIKSIAVATDAAVREGEGVALPLIAYYGTGRLWQEPKESYRIDDPEKAVSKQEQSRLAGYEYSVDPRLSVRQLTRWIARQSWIAFQKRGRTSAAFDAVKAAIIGCVEGATDLYFDAAYGEVVVEIEGGRQPFSNLSDGQRCMLAMVGDMAQKAAKLNPQFGGEVLQRTQGVVLIDELDLHLHPRWQRRIIGDLRHTFPGIQFICTTHSPFLIQAIGQGRLIQLDGTDSEALEYENRSIEDIAEFVQGVETPQVSQRALESHRSGYVAFK